MPTTPTTKSQVQAYRFVLRRMQSALVRKDAVMLHDPMRTHSRATIVGVCLAVLGVLGFVIVGLLSPAPTVPDNGIIIAEPSGTVYVVSGNPNAVLAGVDTFDRELREGESLLVKAQNNKTYLIYRTPTTVNQQNANAVRAEVDMNDASVVQALHLDPNTVRLISTGLLNAI